MVLWCSVSLVDLKLWKFEVFRLIVTSAQVFHVFCDGWVRFWAKCPLHNLTAYIHDLYFSFPIYCPFKIPDTIFLLGCPCIINVWLLTSGSGKCHVFINWHFLTESMVSCKELWRNKCLIETFILSCSQKWPFKDLKYWLNWRAHSDYFPSGSRFLNLHQLH